MIRFQNTSDRHVDTQFDMRERRFPAPLAVGIERVAQLGYRLLDVKGGGGLLSDLKGLSNNGA